jgi:hypothetical protein
MPQCYAILKYHLFHQYSIVLIYFLFNRFLCSILLFSSSTLYHTDFLYSNILTSFFPFPLHLCHYSSHLSFSYQYSTVLILASNIITSFCSPFPVIIHHYTLVFFMLDNSPLLFYPFSTIRSTGFLPSPVPFLQLYFLLPFSFFNFLSNSA